MASPSACSSNVPVRSTAIRQPNVSVTELQSTVTSKTPLGLGNSTTAARTESADAAMSTYTDTNASIHTDDPDCDESRAAPEQYFACCSPNSHLTQHVGHARPI